MATAARQLTEKQQAFTTRLLVGGVKPTQAAREAGYAFPEVEAFKLLRHPVIAAELVTQRAKQIEIEGGNLAYQTLKDCCDAKNPGSVRVAAAKTLATMAGMLKPDAALVDRRDLQEMSPDELEAQLAKIDQALAGIASKAKPIDAQIIDQQGDNAAV
jgi:hypothetical protein